MDQDQGVRSPPKDRRFNPDKRDDERRRRDRSHSDSDSARDVDQKDRRHRRRRDSPATDDSKNSSEDDRKRRRKSHRRRSRSHSRDHEGRHRHGDQKDRHRARSDERSRHHRHPRSRSPPSKRRRRSRDNDSRDAKSPSPHARSRAPLPSQNDSFKDTLAPTSASGPAPDKQKPNFHPTGLLAKEANTVAGTTTVLKYHEPPEARKPPAQEAWRMYVFKGPELVDTILLHQRSAWLVGRDAKVTDYVLEHPSVSKQHAVLQFRHRTRTDEYGERRGRVKPYVIDLESANGTRLNGRKVEASRFVELVDGDVVKFGESEREYVMMLPEP